MENGIIPAVWMSTDTNRTNGTVIRTTRVFIKSRRLFYSLNLQYVNATAPSSGLQLSGFQPGLQPLASQGFPRSTNYDLSFTPNTGARSDTNPVVLDPLVIHCCHSCYRRSSETKNDLNLIWINIMFCSNTAAQYIWICTYNRTQGFRLRRVMM